MLGPLPSGLEVSTADAQACTPSSYAFKLISASVHCTPFVAGELPAPRKLAPPYSAQLATPHQSQSPSVDVGKPRRLPGCSSHTPCHSIHSHLFSFSISNNPAWVASENSDQPQAVSKGFRRNLNSKAFFAFNTLPCHTSKQTLNGYGNHQQNHSSAVSENSSHPSRKLPQDMKSYPFAYPRICFRIFLGSRVSTWVVSYEGVTGVAKLALQIFPG